MNSSNNREWEIAGKCHRMSQRGGLTHFWTYIFVIGKAKFQFQSIFDALDRIFYQSSERI
jgi:hypothetical protein